MAPARKLRAAIIGAGGRARGSHYVCITRLSQEVELLAMAELGGPPPPHTHTFQQARGFSMTDCCMVADPVLMKEVAEEFGVARTYDDYSEMLRTEMASDGGLDVVYCIMNERYNTPPHPPTTT